MAASVAPSPLWKRTLACSVVPELSQLHRDHCQSHQSFYNILKALSLQPLMLTASLSSSQPSFTPVVPGISQDE